MANSWRKKNLIAHMADHAGMSKAQAEKAYSAMLGGIEEALMSGQTVTLTGFGTFMLTERKARMGRNPRTGQPMYIAAKMAPRFRPGRNLKQVAAESGSGSTMTTAGTEPQSISEEQEPYKAPTPVHAF